MLVFVRLVSLLLAAVVFVVLRMVTDDLGFGAWAVALVGAILTYFVLQAFVVVPILNRAARRASQEILQHLADGGDLAGAVEIAKGLGLDEEAAQRVAEAHRDLLAREVGIRIMQEAVARHRESGDDDELRRFLVEQGIGEAEIEDAVALVKQHAESGE